MPSTPNWFVAIPIHAEALLQPWASAVPAGLRLFHPADLHLTVAFLGPMLPGSSDAVVAQMRTVRFAPFDLVPGQLLGLPSAAHITALSLSIAEGHAQAVALMDAWRSVFWAAAGSPPDLRSPLPHITVARPDRRSGQAGQAAARQWLASATACPIRLRATSLALYTWANDRQQQQFRIVAEIPLIAP